MKISSKLFAAATVTTLLVSSVSLHTEAASNQKVNPNMAKYGLHKKNNVMNQEHVTIGHRGASGYAPEHTFCSYDKSMKEMNSDYLELDLQMTKDGHLIAMHDETLDRTTNGSGRVEDHTLAEIKQLDAGSWFNAAHPDQADPKYVGAKVPTLEEVLNRYGNSVNYYIETKSPDVYPGMEEKLLQQLDQHGLLKGSELGQGRVVIQSFSQPSLQKIHQMNPKIPLVQLLDKFQLQGLSESDLLAIQNYAIGVGPEYTDLNAQNTKHLRDLGFQIHPYTVNDTASMQKLNEYGVTGVFTNYPDLYNQVSGK